jgi:hypothetical protein
VQKPVGAEVEEGDATIIGLCEQPINHDPLSEIELGLTCSTAPWHADSTERRIVIKVFRLQEAAPNLDHELIGQSRLVNLPSFAHLFDSRGGSNLHSTLQEVLIYKTTNHRGANASCTRQPSFTE